MIFDVDFTLAKPGPDLGPEGYQRLGQRFGLELDPARYGEALALADALGMRPLVAHCRLGLGRLYQRIGQGGPAREHLASAATMYRAMEMTYWLAQAETAMNPSDPGARAHVSLDD